MANESIKILKNIAESNRQILSLLRKGSPAPSTKSSGKLLTTKGKVSNSSNSLKTSFKSLSFKNTKLYESPHLKTIADNTKEIISLLKNNKNGAKASSKTSSVATDLSSLAISLKLFNKKSGQNFENAVSRVARGMTAAKEASTNLKYVNQLAQTVKNLGFSLKRTFLTYLILAPIAPVIGFVLATISRAFIVIGKYSKRINKGASAMTRIARSLKSIALGIGFTALVLGSIIAISPMLLLAIPAVLGGLAFTYSIVGLASRPIRKGAKAMGMIGLSMIAISGGIALFSLGLLYADKNLSNMGDPLGTILKVGAILGGLAIMYYVAGKGFSSIVKGSLAFAAIGISMAAVGWGIGKMTETIPEWEDIGKIGASLLGLGLMYAAAGAVSVLIGSGAIAMGLVGVSLAAIGWGVGKMKEGFNGVGTDELIGMGIGIAAMGTTFAGIGLISPLIAAGGLAAGALGLGLFAIGKGVKAYTDSGAENFNSSAFTNVIKDLTTAFESAVSFSAFGGATVGITMGLALSSIASGIGAFANLQSIPLAIGYTKEGQPIYGDKSANISGAILNIKDLLGNSSENSILKPFEDFASKNGDSSGGVLGLLTGVRLGKSNFERGIGAAGQIGYALSSIAEGVGAFMNLQSIPLKTLNPKTGKFEITGNADIISSVSNISKLFNILTKPFETFAAKNLDTGTSLLKIAVGADFGSTPFERAVSALGGIGDVLSSIAGGVSTFANLQNVKVATAWDKNGKPIAFKQVDVDGAINQMSKVLNRVINGLVGIEIPDMEITGLGELISGIANGIATFGKTTDENGKPINLKKATAHLLSSLSVITFGLNKIYKNVDIDGISEITKTISEIINKVMKPISNFSKDLGGAKLSDIGQDFYTGLVRIMKPFLTINNKVFGLNNLRIDKLSTMGKIFKDMAKIQKPFDLFTKSFDKLAISMGTFANNFNMIDRDQVLTFTDWTKSLTDFSKLNINDYETNLKKANTNFGIALDKVRDTFQSLADKVSVSESKDKLANESIDLSPLLLELKQMRRQIANLNSQIETGIDVNVENPFINIKELS